MVEDQTCQHPTPLRFLMMKGQPAQTGMSCVQPNCKKQAVQVTAYIRSMLLPHSGSLPRADDKLVSLSKIQLGQQSIQNLPLAPHIRTDANCTSAASVTAKSKTPVPMCIPCKAAFAQYQAYLGWKAVLRTGSFDSYARVHAHTHTHVHQAGIQARGDLPPNMEQQTCHTCPLPTAAWSCHGWWCAAQRGFPAIPTSLSQPVSNSRVEVDRQEVAERQTR